MVFLNNFNQLRQIQWGKNYDWDVKIDDAPHPFNDWFPATSIEINEGDGIPFTYMPARKDYKVPLMSTSGSINITYNDDENNTLFNWVNDWYAQIYRQIGGILTLEESVKKITILQLNSLKEILSTNSYHVFPYNSNNYRGSSEPELVNYSLSFSIAGKF